MRKILLTILLAFAALGASGQGSVAEEAVQVDASPATVRIWFDRIEREGKVVLSYNASLIEMDRHVACRVSGSATIGQLLGMVLKDYEYRLIPMPGRKILIQILGTRLFDLMGIVREEGSGERLFGATVMVTDHVGRKAFVVTDRNGMFNVGVRRGRCKVSVSYVGYAPYETSTDVEDNGRLVNIPLASIPFEIKTVQVNRRKSVEDMEEGAPSNMVSFSNADLFSQIRILPGVSATSANMNISVSGGATDENLFLLEGFPIYDPGHINSMLTLFNGDALKSVSFYNGFIPTQYDGRLSSVTDIHLRDGNKQEFVNTLSLDMPSASAVFEGPVIKNRLSYLVGGRHSWLDFFDGLVSEDDRMNHSFYDFNLKLSCDLDSVTSLRLSAYNSTDDYHVPENGRKQSILHWENQLYALHFNTQISPKIANSTSLAYSLHTIRAYADEYLADSVGNIRNGIRSLYVNTQFTYRPGNLYTMHWGMKGVLEKYELTAFGLGLANRWQPTKQFSLFYDNHIRITPRLLALVGVNYVSYIPRNYRHVNSIQPRISLKWAFGNNDLLYANLSRMEQFFHHIRVSDVATPFDFIMPSIEGFRPSTATHFEIGWKHYTPKGILELSAYYKRRVNVLALRPSVYIEDSDWSKYIMTGTGDSHGVSLYYYDGWRRFNWQLSYTLSRSYERFDELKERGKIPSAYDIPHVLNGALSYNIGKSSLVTLGGNLRSGLILYDSSDGDNPSLETFRTAREPFRYRIDASYSFRKEFRRSKLLLRFGLYNIMGNPSEEDMALFFSVKIKNHCVPYGTITFKF
ncbi:TonB-dependent receptor domain-containing protein [Prevotella sp. KH2C16]|uniref:TonB-dependent receptor n=1 Tax=Prevotella sp. KH2C16 TaxID=1855325 RepID=UPI0008E68D43|nr:TonB-dependent receptor [Prevotella sp. KH2C16]SFG51126.1 TonB dependent receptor [Prevotella sp. KH2C16]